MANYNKVTDFGSKDNLPSGHEDKIITGTEFDTEFSNVSGAISSKADANGSPSNTFQATTPVYTSDDRNVATTEYVTRAVNNLSLGNIKSVDYTVSEDAPTGGDNGDVWYQI